MIEAKLKAVLAKGHMELPQARMEQAERVETSKFTTKYTKLKCPNFDDSNFWGWFFKIKQFFEDDQTRVQDKVRTSWCI